MSDDMERLLETERKIKELCGNDPDVHRRFMLILQHLILHHPDVDEIIRRLDRGDGSVVSDEDWEGAQWKRSVWLLSSTHDSQLDIFPVCAFGASTGILDHVPDSFIDNADSSDANE